jgi:hypothetical protein
MPPRLKRSFLVVELAHPEHGAPGYNGLDRRELEARMQDQGLMNAELRGRELIAVVDAAIAGSEAAVADVLSRSVSRRPNEVRVRVLT